MQGTGSVGGSGVFVVDKYHAVADEDFIFNGDTLADKGVTGYLAVFADGRAFLDFNEGTDFGVIADTTAVEVDKVVNLDVFS